MYPVSVFVSLLDVFVCDVVVWTVSLTSSSTVLIVVSLIVFVVLWSVSVTLFALTVVHIIIIKSIIHNEIAFLFII